MLLEAIALLLEDISDVWLEYFRTFWASICEFFVFGGEKDICENSISNTKKYLAAQLQEHLLWYDENVALD